jgi:hypothetical protein
MIEKTFGVQRADYIEHFNYDLKFIVECDMWDLIQQAGVCVRVLWRFPGP